jgi:hypothetical protein
VKSFKLRWQQSGSVIYTIMPDRPSGEIVEQSLGMNGSTQPDEMDDVRLLGNE